MTPLKTYLTISIAAASSALSQPINVPVHSGKVTVNPKNFRFSIIDSKGKTIAPAHSGAGASLNGSALSVIQQTSPSSFLMASAKGEKATMEIQSSGNHIQFTFKASEPAQKTNSFAIQVGGSDVAYGLGDAGGWNPQLNLINERETTYKTQHNGSAERWLSSFTIFPHNQLAGVSFDGALAVTLGKNRYKMAATTHSGSATFSYFTGSPREIYASYKNLLKQHDFPIIKPKFRLFELGWESWAALGWQTNADTMLNSITELQNAGFPIRWAVSGSGFWEEGGTTTSFGKWGEKFSKPRVLKQKLHARDVKWMIGLRTNFVPTGGPFEPVSKKRDQNLKVSIFNSTPHSQTAEANGYLLKQSYPKQSELWRKPSAYFPIVPCHLLDGNNPEAAEWYAKLYQQWEVDGIKEDTMMSIGSEHSHTFNQPIAKIAKDGALVMARCGSFSAPGTLLRINDTHVPEFKKRIPINYLQYAASGAPNVYSDTVGFRKMKHYSELVVRHGWLQALTAGMAVGESASHWKKHHQKIYKKPFDFHYQIAPTLYDAATKSYLSGYPATMTPLAIAFPEDTMTSQAPNFQWMIGDSLLCAPVLKNPEKSKIDIYLPKGIWFDYDTGQKFVGPKLLKDYAMPVTKTPCFVGGAGLIVTRQLGSEQLKATLYPTQASSEPITIHHPDGTTSTIVNNATSIQSKLWNGSAWGDE